MKLKFDEESIKLLKEISTSNGLGSNVVDDGPNTFWSDVEAYYKENEKIADKLGLKIINYMIKDRDSVQSFGHEKMGNDGAKMKDIDKDKMSRLVSLVGGKVIEKYIERLAEQEIDRFLEENDIEYIEHIIKDE